MSKGRAYYYAESDSDSEVARELWRSEKDSGKVADSSHTPLLSGFHTDDSGANMNFLRSATEHRPLFQQFFDQLYRTKRRKVFVTAMTLAALAMVFLVSLFRAEGHRGLVPVSSSKKYQSSSDIAPEIKPIDLANATAVFNTIQSALRNKDSQIHPVGVSFIPAYVPKGIRVFHGTANREVPDGLEWVAFDHEFSFYFISNRMIPPKNGGDGPRGIPDSLDLSDGKSKEKRHLPPSHRPPPPFKGKGYHEGPPGGLPGELLERHPGRTPVGLPKLPTANETNNHNHGTIFTFEVVEPLNRMILLDGSSAAKLPTGEMDHQMILAGSEDGMMDERDAAARICEWGKPFGLDGYVRVEVGFEAVICNFRSEKLKLIANTTIDWEAESVGFTQDTIDSDKDLKDFLKYFAPTSGYSLMKQGNVHSKRDRRILLDYRGMQTPVNKTYISPDTYTRRMLNISQDLKSEMIRNLEEHLKEGANPTVGTDWQLVTTEIVDKFAPILKLINNTLSEHDLTDEAEYLYAAKNLTLFTLSTTRFFYNHHQTDPIERLADAKKRAVHQYSGPLQTNSLTEPEALILSSVTKVVSEIIDVVFLAFEGGREGLHRRYSVNSNSAGTPMSVDLATVKSKTISLLNSLQWTAYYGCSKKCNWDEVCYTPSWGPSPMGWGNSIGLRDDGSGIKRIDKDERCLSLREVAELSEWDHL